MIFYLHIRYPHTKQTQTEAIMLDILIIGAGPAGSTLARLLGSASHLNYKVGLLEKRTFDANAQPLRKKACGGLLAPDAQKMMATLGLSLPGDILETPQLFKVRTIDFDHGYERSYQRYYYNMDREKFDRYLYSLIPSTVDTRTGVVVNRVRAVQDHWVVDYFKDGVLHTIMAKFLVAADGASSTIRKQVLPEYAMPKKYISIQKWYDLAAEMPYYTGIFDSSITDYYSWTIQKGDKLILGTALPYKATLPHEAFNRLETKVSDYLGLKLGNPIKTEGAFIDRSTHLNMLRFAAQINMADGNRLSLALIGEAAGATSPTSAEGFSYAFKTSLKLFKAFEGGLEHAALRYEMSCDAIRINILLKQMKSPGMYAPRLRHFVMKTGISALKEHEGAIPYRASDRTCAQSPSFHKASLHGH